jgi:hypothetical protein
MKSLKKIINSKHFFWTSIILTSLLFYVYIKDKSYKCILLFIAVSLISNSYCKNVALALFVSMLVSNIIFGCGKMKEGLENKTDPTEGNTNPKEGNTNMNISPKELQDMSKLVKSGSINTDSLEQVKGMMGQFNELKKQGGNDIGVDLSSLDNLLQFNNKISATELSSKDDVKKAVGFLRGNKQMLINMIKKF